MAGRRTPKHDEELGVVIVGLVLLGAVIWAVQTAVRWIGQDHHLAWVTAVVGGSCALVLVLKTRKQPFPEDTAAAGGGVMPGAAFLTLAALIVAVSIYSFAESTVAGVLALTVGGFGISFVGWSWWRPFHLRVGPRLHFPWWHRLARLGASAGAAALLLRMSRAPPSA